MTWELFDLDGCLVDSSAAIPAALNAGLAAIGEPERDPADLQWCIGPPLLDSYARLLAATAGCEPAEVPRDRVTAGVDGYRAAYPEISRALTRPVPGIAELLAAHPVRRAVVTSKPGAFAAPILAETGLADFFQGLYAPEVDHDVEPKEVTLRRALDGLAAAAATTVMVGDRHHDVDAGRACGTGTIGVTWGAGGAAELAHADEVVSTPAELADALRRRAPGR